MKKVGKVIAWILLVLVLVGAVGLVLKFTDGGTTDFKTFYVEINGETFLNKGNYALRQGKNRFETKYVFASNKPEKHKGYNIKIVPNITDETKFDFTVDEQIYSFAGEKDLTSGFDIEKDKTGFTISVTEFKIQDILQAVYGKPVTVDDNQIDYGKVYFKLVVSSADGENVVVIGLRPYIAVDSIIFDKDGIIF